MKNEGQEHRGRAAMGPEGPDQDPTERDPREESEKIFGPVGDEGIELAAKAASQLLRGVSEDRKRRFLLALAVTGNRSRAFRAAGVSSTAVWEWNRSDPAFSKAYVRCMELASDLMEDELVRRATEGVVEPVFQGGRFVGSIRRYSDHCLTFALKGAKPDKYADRQKVDLNVDVADRLVRARERALGRAAGEKEDE